MAINKNPTWFTRTTSCRCALTPRPSGPGPVSCGDADAAASPPPPPPRPPQFAPPLLSSPLLRAAQDDQAYLISVGAVSAILALFVYLCGKSLCCLSPDTLNTVLFRVGGEDMTVTLLIAQFLFVWTGAGAIVATFGVPGGGCFSNPSETANG